MVRNHFTHGHRLFNFFSSSFVYLMEVNCILSSEKAKGSAILTSIRNNHSHDTVYMDVS